MDIQGAEGAAIRGARGVLARPELRGLVLEFWPGALREAGEDPEAVLAEIRAAGLRCANQPALDADAHAYLAGVGHEASRDLLLPAPELTRDRAGAARDPRPAVFHDILNGLFEDSNMTGRPSPGRVDFHGRSRDRTVGGCRPHDARDHATTPGPAPVAHDGPGAPRPPESVENSNITLRSV